VDDRARDALEGPTRKTVSAGLDELANEVERLRRTVALLERHAISGERRRQVAELLRAAGLSSRTIAQATAFTG
jgi:hypothetical protein